MKGFSPFVILLSRVSPDASWAHWRRKFYELADLKKQARSKTQRAISPMAFEAVKRIDALFDFGRALNGRPADERLAARREHSAPLMTELEAWMREERAKLSRHAAVAKAMDDRLRRWEGFARFLQDGRICLTNNAAERALRGLALARKSWLFAGSDRGGDRAAVIYTLIGTAKLNDIDPRLGSPTRSIASPSIPPRSSISRCPGTGRRRSSKTPPSRVLHQRETQDR
jgi:hypothetical protein